MYDIGNISFSIYNVPGGNKRVLINQILDFGREIRETLLWNYPILPTAVMTFIQLASSREVKVSAPTARAASRAVDWLNEARSENYDGTFEYGYPSILKRRALDYISVGRTIYFMSDKLYYIDPAYTKFNFNPSNSFWFDQLTHTKYQPEVLAVNHAYPIGRTGMFMCPLAPVIPTATLAWLIREHDRAMADGRKIRDIFIAGTKQMAESMSAAVEKSLKLWAGADPRKNGIPIIYLDNLPPGISVQDMIGRLGLAEIPQNLNRSDFQFEYVNEISAAIGLTLRHFWNSEKATNRALEDMQEARQLQKGPSEFVRTEQRIINNHPEGIKRFGNRVRMGFIEETDSQTQETRGKVLKAFSNALLSFAKVFGGQVNGDAFLAWLQSEDILPPDLNLITEMGKMVVPDKLPVNEENPDIKTEQDPSPLSSGEKSLDYGELSMNLNYQVLDRRMKPYNGVDLVKSEVKQDDEFMKALEPIDLSFHAVLLEARKENFISFKELYPEEEISQKDFNDLNDEEHRIITQKTL